MAGTTAQIHPQLSRAHLNSQAAQRKGPQVEPYLSPADARDEIGGNLVVEPQVPFVCRAAQVDLA